MLRKTFLQYLGPDVYGVASMRPQRNAAENDVSLRMKLFWIYRFNEAAA